MEAFHVRIGPQKSETWAVKKLDIPAEHLRTPTYGHSDGSVIAQIIEAVNALGMEGRLIKAVELSYPSPLSGTQECRLFHVDG